MAWLTGFTYRKKINITPQASAGTDCQLKFLIGKSSGATGENFDLNNHCLDTFADLRFTDNDEETELKYWIQEVADSGTSKLATVYVKITDDLSSGTPYIYCYYGKADATTTSSGADTFIDFDNFENSLDSWTATHSNSILSSTDQAKIGSYSLKFIDDSTSAAEGGSRTSLSISAGNSIIFWVYFSETNKYVNFEGRDGSGTSDQNLRLYWDTDGDMKYYDGSFKTIGAYSTGWHKYEVKPDFTNNKFKLWVDESYQNEYSLHNSKTKWDRYNFISSTAGTRTWYMDAYIQRKALYGTEPSYSSADAEESQTSGLNMQVKVGSTWKNISSAQIKIGSNWKNVSGVQIKIGNNWKNV
jgi:hypothetical protein